MTGAPAQLSFPGEFELDFYGTEESLRQGDLLQMIPKNIGEALSPWECHFGVIVTADCDLAFGKHAGLLTYVPVVPVDVFVHHLFAPRLVERKKNQSFAKVARCLEGAGKSSIADRTHELLELGNEERIDRLFSAELTDTATAARAEASRFLAYRRALELLEESDDISETMAILRGLSEELDSVDGAKTKNLPNILGNIKQGMGREIPGDYMFLNALSEEHGHGYVAILRMIQGVSEASISLSALEERRRGASVIARRIGRLNVLYTHKLVQHMAKVFTDIGLPLEYERSRDERIQSRLDEWTTQGDVSAQELS